MQNKFTCVEVSGSGGEKKKREQMRGIYGFELRERQCWFARERHNV
jgi:hypothetical protein